MRLSIASIMLFYAEEIVVGSEHSLAGPAVFLWTERALAGFFTFELLGRWRAAGWSWKHVSSPHFWIDLIAIGPFYIGFFVPTAWLHTVRTMRILRLLKFIPFIPGVHLLTEALTRAWPQIRTLLAMEVIITMFSTAAIYECERFHNDSPFDSLFDSIWFTAVTVTTVGYGDITPVTAAGRIIALLTFMTGLVLFAVFAGVVGGSMTDVLREEQACSDQIAG